MTVVIGIDPHNASHTMTARRLCSFERIACPDTWKTRAVRSCGRSSAKNGHASPGTGWTAGRQTCDDPAPRSTETIHPEATYRHTRKPRPVNARPSLSHTAAGPTSRESQPRCVANCPSHAARAL